EAVFTLDDLDANVFGPDPVAEVLIAERADGGVAGMALYFRTYSTWVGRSGIWIEDLFVRPEFRGEGHGRALLDAVRARTDGRVEWVVLDWNEPAIGFYRSIGAEPVDGWTRFRWQPEG
ncbi:MAG: N-acetyltransferase family protein, partial [Acidimicrobiales bacterium]